MAQRAAVLAANPRTGRLAAWTRATPGRLTSLLILLTLLGLAAGVVGVAGIAQRSTQVDAVTQTSGPLTVRAQELYRALSDADATAAGAFLTKGGEPAALRQRYLDDLAAASAALAAATAGDGDQPAVRQIAAQLPIYAGLVETARTYNRLNMPLGAGYLREASGLMRDQLLTAARKLYVAETGRLAADRDGAAGLPWFALLLGLLSLAGLGYAQVFLTRRTHRLFNVGLLAASLAALIGVGWLVGSWAASAGHLDAARTDGSAQVQLLAQARIDALQARADEALTLVARGNGGGFEQEYGTVLVALAGKDGTGGLLGQARAAATDSRVRARLDAAITDTRAWRAAHTALRAKDDAGQYPEAVVLATGSGPGSTATLFNRLDTDLGQGIGVAEATFDRDAQRAGGSLTGAAPGLGVLTLILLVGVAAGFQRRIAEYR
jgi:hypothetical protein